MPPHDFGEKHPANPHDYVPKRSKNDFFWGELSNSGGRLLELNKTLMTIGRKGVQVAMISRRPQGFFITHVEGARFPALNGRMLDAQAHALADRDVIDIAGIRLEFLRKD